MTLKLARPPLIQLGSPSCQHYAAADQAGDDMTP
jgi:hypothetical protein